MKTKKTNQLLRLFWVVTFLISLSTLQAQIQFQGLMSENEGGAVWDADGSGPEPYGNGHGGYGYYVASRDYVNPSSSAGSHLTNIVSGFPAFAQALADNGYTLQQVKFKVGLSSIGEDQEGEDWFSFGDEHYINFYSFEITVLLDEELLLTGTTGYWLYHIGPSTSWDWNVKTNYFVPVNASGSSSPGVQAVASAFLQDVGDEEVFLTFQTVGNSQPLSGNGRNGSYWSLTGSIEKGLPQIPLQGLYADNEGIAAWDADGSGPEPFGDGHADFLYYGSSLDYDDINPSPDACLAHFLDGSTGFFNTMLQLEYRGFVIGDMKIKESLVSLGPDVEGEDWGFENGHDWLNYYNNGFIIELNGEPILEIMQDTNKLVEMTSYWECITSVAKVYDISANASPEAQFVAQSFMKDLGTHYLKTAASSMTFAATFTGNGRDGAFYNVVAGAVTGVHDKTTFVPGGVISGTWTAEHSPYYVEGDLSIQNGQTLTIEPGVKVAVRGPYHFTVQGCVMAEGTEDDNIIFISSNPVLWWDGFDYRWTPSANDTSVFDHCTFKQSSAQGPANLNLNCGGVFAITSYNKLKICNSMFNNNKADLTTPSYYACGGAIALITASPVISNCVFYNNVAQFGGALFCYANSNPEISRCLFYNNHAVAAGAIAINNFCHLTLLNNTIILNSVENTGGGVEVYDHCEPDLINNIIWDNQASTGSQVSVATNDCNVDITYNDIEGGQAGIGPYGIGTGVYENNIDEDPEFVDVSAFDFHILEPSPCHNSGDTTILDPDGSVSDMGYCFTWCTTSVGEPFFSDMHLTVFPNPVGASSLIEYSLLHNSPVTLKIIDLSGREMATLVNEVQQKGEQKVVFNIAGLPAGVYFCVLKTNEGIQTKKMIKLD